MTEDQKHKLMQTVFDLLEKGCADDEFTVAIQHGRIFLDSEDGAIVLNVVGFQRR